MVSPWRWLWDSSRARRRWRLESGNEPAGRPTFSRKGPPAVARPMVPPVRILFVNQYYWPDHASTAQHLTDLAETLAQRGYECHVVCSQGSYKPGQERRPAHEEHHGVHIHRVGATALGRRSGLTRMTDYLTFYALALCRCLALPRFDVVATLTTPPIIGLVGTLLRRLRGSRHVFWSMDLLPDASVALGRFSPRNPLISALAHLSDAVYRRADKVVVLGPYMADRIAAKQVRRDRVTTIPVWSRSDEVYPLPRQGHPLREELGLSDKFVAMYSGNLGLAHSFDEFLEAARRLRDDNSIVFLFVGDGPRLAEVRAAQAREQLSNIRLLDYFPRQRLHESLSLADVHLVSMRREMTGVVVPGKLYGAMASGRPTVFVGPEHCESADTIRQAGCGFTIRLGDVQGLVKVLRQLATDPQVACDMGQRGREAFLAHHDKDVCCARWTGMLGDLVGGPRPSRPTFAASPALPPQMSGTF